MLGPILFLIYINDLDTGVMNWILKFADNTKIYARICQDKDAVGLQSDLNRLLQWSLAWQMHFHVKKCNVMHIGKKNQSFKYTRLVVVESVKELRVILLSDLKTLNQCQKVYAKANRVLGMLYRATENKTPEVIVRLYKPLVRPHVEYCTAAWSLTTRKTSGENCC